MLALAAPVNASFQEQHINTLGSGITQKPTKLKGTVKSLKKATTSVKPQVSHQPTSAPTGNIETIVREAARKYGIDENHFVNIARCESTFNPNSVNRNYYENGHPSGLFQHISGYWPARAAKYGHPGASVFDARANAEVTAQMFRDGHANLWECK